MRVIVRIPHSLCTHYKFISVFRNFKPKTINVNEEIRFRQNSFPSLLLWSNLICIFYLFFFSFFFLAANKRLPSTHIFDVFKPSAHLRCAFSSRAYSIDLKLSWMDQNECMHIVLLRAIKMVKNVSKWKRWRHMYYVGYKISQAHVACA